MEKTIEEMDPASDAQIMPEDNEKGGGDFHDNQINLSPNSSVQEIEMHHSETTPKIEMPYTSTTEKVIAAVPLSYKLPGDNDIITTSRNKNIEEPPKWLQNWVCQPRQRSNGKFDKYYYHKKLKMMCRSVKEIERFELHGIRPGFKDKEKERVIKANETVKIAPKRIKIICTSSEKLPVISVEKKTAAEDHFKKLEANETVKIPPKRIKISTSSRNLPIISVAKDHFKELEVDEIVQSSLKQNKISLISKAWVQHEAEKLPISLEKEIVPKDQFKKQEADETVKISSKQNKTENQPISIGEETVAEDQFNESEADHETVKSILAKGKKVSSSSESYVQHEVEKLPIISVEKDTIAEGQFKKQEADEIVKISSKQTKAERQPVSVEEEAVAKDQFKEYEDDEIMQISSKQSMNISSSSNTHVHHRAEKQPIFVEKETITEDQSKKSKAKYKTPVEDTTTRIKIYTGSNGRIKSAAEIAVEKFLAEAHYNLLHLFDNEEGESSEDSME